MGGICGGVKSCRVAYDVHLVSNTKHGVYAQHQTKTTFVPPQKTGLKRTVNVMKSHHDLRVRLGITKLSDWREDTTWKIKA
jgi:hypothetical protein